MSTSQTNPDVRTEASTATATALRLEAIVLPVADVDRAKTFYESLGWRLDADFPLADDYRIVQFTPPGSAASIQFGTGTSTQQPGTAQGLYLAVADIEAARDELIGRGVAVSEIWHGRGVGTTGHLPGPDPERASYRSYATFSDPDGNSYLLQEITDRLPGRE